MIRSVLVANRGEIARRVFRTCRDLGIETVAVFSDADADAPFVREADRSVRLHDPASDVPSSSPADTYLRADLVLQVAARAGADAVHPGYGFLSENADFARAVRDAGLTWIGPTPESIEAMGSKIRAKELMAAADVPILSVDPDTATADDFPLLVKASAGGGGRGMRVVTDPADLAGELTAAAAEAASAFGDDTVFVEPYLPAARHVEVQVLADTHGTLWILGDRDCSIQRRHQKVVEEAPAPGLSDATRTVLHDAARAAAEAVGYVGAGTVEFLVDGERVFFLEMNTRLQVEHRVTEVVFGLDLVAHQIAVAEGQALGEAPDGPHGHAVEVRLYAEDPAEDWAPQTGTLRAFDIPDGVLCDSAVETGSTIGIHYDAMIAKLIAYDHDRPTALRALTGALRRSRIHGVRTNRDLLLAVLGDADVVAERLSTRLLEDRLAEWTAPRTTERERTRAAVAAALAQAETNAAERRVQQRVPVAYRNVPSRPQRREYEGGLVVEYTGGRGGLVQQTLDDVTVRSSSPTRVVLDDGGVEQAYAVSVTTAAVDVDGPDGSFSFVPVPAFVDPADVVAEGSLLAPMPATVVSVVVEPGDEVTHGQPIVVLEAMKMQHTITAPADGLVATLAAEVGQQVESGAVLAVIEIPDDDGADPAPSDPAPQDPAQPEGEPS